MGRCGFPGFTAFVGRVIRWRSFGCVVRAQSRQFALLSVLDGFLCVGGILYRLHPEGRLFAL